MKENSIEEDIKDFEQWLKFRKEDKNLIGFAKSSNPTDESITLKQFDNILSDYKRVLKENEELKSDIANMYDEEVVISIISDKFNLSRNEILELLGEN